MRIKYRFLIVNTVIVLILLPNNIFPVTPINNFKLTTKYSQVNLKNTPIFIAKDSDFPTYSTGGNGTKQNPYIIENFVFDTTKETVTDPVQIRNTGKNFILRNISIIGDQSIYAGIYIYNVYNGVLTNNSIENCYRGFDLTNSVNFEITKNNLNKNANGIYVSSSSNVRLR